MITLRNTDLATSVSARASTSDLVAGMIVAFVAGTASGDQPKVRKATLAELTDATVVKGIVDYIEPDSQAVDFNYAVQSQVLTVIPKLIPQNAQVNVWIGKMVVAYHDSDLPAALKSGTVREPAKVAFNNTTNLPCAYNSGGVDGSNGFVGIVYRVDPSEVSFLITVQ